MLDNRITPDSKIRELPFWQDRDLSWLSYAHRILDLSGDESVPLLGRLDFMAIYQARLKQFVEQRIGSFADRLEAYRSAGAAESADEKGARKVRTKGYHHDADQADRAKRLYKETRKELKELFERIGEMSFDAQDFYMRACGDLRRFGVDHMFGSRLSQDLPQYQKIFLHEYMKNNVYGYLAPYVVDANAPFPYLEDDNLYIVTELTTKAKSKDNAKDKKRDKKAKREKDAKGALDAPTKLGIVALPKQCVRLIKLPTGDGKNLASVDARAGIPAMDEGMSAYAFVLLEDALCLFAKDVFPHYKVEGAAVVSLVRNADLDRFKHVDSDDEEYSVALDGVLAQRNRQEPLLLMMSDGITKRAKKILQSGLGLKSHQMQRSGLPLDMSYLEEVAVHLNEHARDRLSWPEVDSKWLRTGPLRLNPNHSILDQVACHDVLLMYPYESMDPFLAMLREAVFDPSVSAIDMTIFRLAEDSEVAASLMEAARCGKRVRVVVEVRASFAEAENMEWARRFKQAGCEVLFGLEEYKVHAKLCCITRSVGGALQRITQIGTGNYDEKTAQYYTDFCFMTADSDIGSDAGRLFDNLEKGDVSDECKVLKTSPLQLRKTLIRELDQQIARARSGESSGVFFKVNALTDKEVIAKLVEASQAGVPVVMIVRDATCVLPGIEGYTDKIRIASLVGRLLEHSRIYGFGDWDDMQIYLSSADLMKRNLDRRVEIAWPIVNRVLRKRIIQYANLCLNDTSKLRELLPDGSYTPLGALAKEDRNGRKELFDSQEYLLRKG